MLGILLLPDMASPLGEPGVGLTPSDPDSACPFPDDTSDLPTDSRGTAERGPPHRRKASPDAVPTAVWPKDPP